MVYDPTKTKMVASSAEMNLILFLLLQKSSIYKGLVVDSFDSIFLEVLSKSLHWILFSDAACL